ncbi:hypothetical protein NBRC10513v2_002669 [Rhodotorula toruloides]
MTEKTVKCAVCDKDTKLRCSGCGILPFCGAACQKLLWPTHKTLCKVDPEVFHSAPLTPYEMGEMRPRMKKAYGHDDGKSIFTLTVLDMVNTEVLEALATPPPGKTPLNDSFWTDRAEMLRVVRDDLDYIYQKGPGPAVTGGGPSDPRRADPWYLVRYTWTACLAASQDDRDGSLVHCTLLWQKTRQTDPAKREEMASYAELAHKRLVQVWERDLMGSLEISRQEKQRIPELRDMFCVPNILQTIQFES